MAKADAAVSQDANATKLQQFADWVSSGHRQRFSTISREEVVAWALDNSKQNDSCKELKASIDSGVTESNVPNVLMARVVKAYMLSLKQDGLDAKGGRSKETESAVDDGKKKKEDPKAVKKVATPAKGLGKLAEASNLPSSTASADLMQWVREPDNRKGDEPFDGPDAYYYLKDLDSPEFLAALSEETGVQIDAIIRAVDNSDVKKTEKDDTTNAPWQTLRNRSIAVKESWRSTAWTSINYTAMKDIKEAFEVVSEKIYLLLERRKSFEAFYREDKLIAIPQVQVDQVDLRYYDHLIAMANNGGNCNADIVLALLLEYVARSIPSLDQAEATDIIDNQTGALRQYLEKELFKAAIDVTKVSKDDKDLTQALKIIESSDSNLLNAYFMKSLQGVDLDADELLKKIQNSYSSGTYVFFLQRLKEFKNKIVAHLEAESLKMQTEFVRNTKVKDIRAIDKFHAQLEFERICLDADTVAPTLDDWRWFGAINTSSLLQAIEDAKVIRPSIHYKFSNILGKLLLVLKSPGPLGCFEHHTEKEIHVRSKVGFSLFNDLYDPNTTIMAGDKPSALASKQTSAYDINDKLITIRQKNSFLYPANDIIINVAQNSSASMGSESRTKISWSDNTIQFNGTDQSRSGIANLTARFCDNSTFSISTKADSLSLQFSDDNGNHYTFGKDGSITCQSFIRLPVTSNMKGREIKRVYLPSGIVIKHMELGGVVVLYPDGSYAVQSAGSKEWNVFNFDVRENNATESHVNTEEIQVSSNSLVTITKVGSQITAEHACSTIIETNPSKSVGIKSPGSAEIRFENGGRQVITVSAHFSVERKFVNGLSSLVKVQRKDMVIDVSPSGEAVIKLTSLGFSESITEDCNAMNINWIAGTLTLRDVCNYVFETLADGRTSVVRLEETKFPGLSFGGRLLKTSLGGGSNQPMLGNTPVLFAVSPSGTGHFQVQRDADVLRNYQSKHHTFYRMIEEAGIVPGSMTFSTTAIFKVEGIDQTLVKYSELTRYSAIEAEIKSILTKEFIDLEERVRSRNETLPLKDLGETAKALLSTDSSTNSHPFVFGMNKDATQLAILLKFLEKEGLSENPGVHMNTEMQKIMKNAKDLMKSKKQQAACSAEKVADKKSIKKKVPSTKDFESPEGKAYTGSAKQLEREMTEISFSTVEKVATPIIQPQHTGTIPSTPEVSQEQKPTTAEVSILQTLPPLTKEPKKKPRIKLPTSLIGARPGAVPNIDHIARETETKRRLNTVSTATNKHIDGTLPTDPANYGTTGFEVLQPVLDFGAIVRDKVYTGSIDMKNTGIEPARFLLRPSTAILTTVYKHGPVAPGMSIRIAVSIKIADCVGEFREEIEVVSETEILHIPVLANITS